MLLWSLNGIEMSVRTNATHLLNTYRLLYIWKSHTHKLNIWCLLTRRPFLLLWSTDVKCFTDKWNQNHEQSHNLSLTCKFMTWTKWMLLSILQPHSCLSNVRILFAFTFLIGIMVLWLVEILSLSYECC